MLAEEAKEGTLEWLTTKPIADFQIVLGKWLASWSLILICLLFSLPFYITVAIIGPLDHTATLSGYVALILLGGAYSSIGIYASSLTKKPDCGFYY